MNDSYKECMNIFNLSAVFAIAFGLIGVSLGWWLWITIAVLLIINSGVFVFSKYNEKFVHYDDYDTAIESFKNHYKWLTTTNLMAMMVLYGVAAAIIGSPFIAVGMALVIISVQKARSELEKIK